MGDRVEDVEARMVQIIKDLIKLGPLVQTSFCKWEVIIQICVLERLFGGNEENGSFPFSTLEAGRPVTRLLLLSV